MIWYANESGHHDLSTAVQRLCRDVDERQSCYVEEPCHAGTTCNGAMTEQHVQRQVVQAELAAKISGMPYRRND